MGACFNVCMVMNMNFDKIPPLLQSTSNPIILGHKKYLHKLDRTFKRIDKNSSIISDFDAGVADHYASTNHKKDKFDPERHDKLHLQKHSHTEEGRLAEAMFGDFNKHCQLKKVGPCYIMVRNCHDTQLGGSHNTLPGVVDFVNPGSQPNLRKEIRISLSNKATKYWNAQLQFSCSGQIESFIEYCRHYMLQIRKFLCKLQLAINAEENYIKQLESTRVKYLSTLKNSPRNFASNDSLYDSNSSGVFITEQNEKNYQTNEQIFIRPPKLGKVYAELQAHSKAWHDVNHKWQAYRQGMSLEMLECLQDYKQQISCSLSHMLTLVQKVIVSRLASFAGCATVRSKNERAEREWDRVFGTGCLKRFCKLIEVYNKILRKQNQPEFQKHIGQTSLRSSPPLVDGLSTSLDNRQKLIITAHAATAQSFTITRILSLLSGPVKEDLASSILCILSLIQREVPDSNDQYEFVTSYDLQNGKVDWGNADDFEIDEDQVITHVVGCQVNSISDNYVANDSLSSIKQLLYAQGSFIVSFMNYLASNTSLLHGNLRSKSPRSAASSQQFADDVSAISSDDEASSVASSSFFSQLSSTGGTNSNRKRKTVLWRDSWDQEAVKSLSKSYMAVLVTEGPVHTLLTRISRPDPNHVTHPSTCCDDESGASGSLQQSTSGFRPRFWSDVQPLMLDACISNMMILDILPDDVLEGVQESTQTFIIEKALVRWDSNMCEALGIGIKDKCGCLPGQAWMSLSKTAWLYIEALHCLMFIMDKYNRRDDVVQETLPRLETTLDAFFKWCQGKIQQFLSSWSLRALMQVSLGDLSQLTALGLDCLPLIEKCHNHVESRRLENPATLHFATKHLKNIDATITHMQSLSGDCMKMYMNKCSHIGNSTIKATFPSHKFWRQNNLSDHGSANTYMEKTVKTMIYPICNAVSALDARSQLAAIPPAISAVFDAIIQHVVQKSIRFSVQGALRLQRDFEFVIDYICSDEARLCADVRRAVPFLSAVKRALWVAKTLQRTDLTNEVKNGKTGYEESPHHTRLHGEGYTERQDDNDWALNEKDLLALRIHNKPSKRWNRKWFSLPCSE